MTAIKVENLVKQYKNGVCALNNLSLNVKFGDIFSLLGPNGAGKSSLINILTTCLPKTSGKVSVLGYDIEKDPEAIRKQIAYVAQHTSIDNHLSMEENMIFQSRLYRVNKIIAKKRMKNLISCFKLEHYLKYPVASYSGGVKRKVDIAMNMMSQPKILFLDEPTVGMDIQSRMAMWDMVKKIRDDFETTIFLTTHYLEEADKLSDTICIMKDGHEIVQASPYALKEYMHQDVLRISFYNEKDIRKELNSVSSWLLEHNIPFKGIEIVEPSLDDIFLNLTEANRKEALL